MGLHLPSRATWRHTVPHVFAISLTLGWFLPVEKCYVCCRAWWTLWFVAFPLQVRSRLPVHGRTVRRDLLGPTSCRVTDAATLARNATHAASAVVSLSAATISQSTVTDMRPAATPRPPMCCHCSASTLQSWLLKLGDKGCDWSNWSLCLLILIYSQFWTDACASLPHRHNHYYQKTV